MSDVMRVIREAILGTSGLGGELRFNALYAGSFETEDDRPDLPSIIEAVSHAFPPEQAETIMAAVGKKLGNSPHVPMPVTQPAKETKATIPAVENHESGSQDGTTAFAKYFNVDPGNVRDIVSEARRVRLALGKTIVMPPGLPADSMAESGIATGNAAADSKAEKTIKKTADKAIEVQDRATVDQQAVPDPVKPPAIAVMSKPRAIAEPVSEIDREIEQFAYGQTAYSSIDIIDFIRYMKDKGYSFEECIVLEKIYVKIEERKKEARSAIEKEVEGIFKGAQAPAEPDISRLIGHLKETGLVFEDEDVRRMARVVALRRAQKSL